MGMYRWINISSADDFSQLAAALAPEFGPDRVVQILRDGINSAVQGVLIEDGYVDKDYRSTYYHFYSKMGRPYRADCVRLHFFDSAVTFDPDTLDLRCADRAPTDHYFGYMVLRPTMVATIGRTVMSSDVRMGARGQVIHALHKVHLLGHKLHWYGFPSMDQHADIAVCAHVACWSILRHYSELYSQHRELLVHDITLMAHQFDPGGLVPANGLDVFEAERVFQAAGTYPLLVSKNPKSPQSFYREGLMTLWRGRCAISGLDVPELLRASHAKPWAASTDAERLDVYNGLLLAAHLDAAFDAGLITILADGTVGVSSALPPHAMAVLKLDTRITVSLSPRHEAYLAWHRDHVFRR